MRIAVAAQTRNRAGFGVNACGHISRLIGVARRAVHRSGMIRMRIALDVGVAIGTTQAAVDAFGLFLTVNEDAVPCLILQVLLPVTGQAVVILLRQGRYGGEEHCRDEQAARGDARAQNARGSESSPELATKVHLIPSSVSTFGLCSSTAMRSWQASQSLGMVFPSVDVWLPSWQRKQPGQSVCPMLLG